MSTLSTHVLDTARGKPAAGVRVRLEVLRVPGGTGGAGDEWTRVCEGVTDADGRVKALAVTVGERLKAGTYRLRFETGEYQKASGHAGFFPFVEVAFTVAEGGGHYHVPLLLSPFGYSTYRGS